MMTIVERQDIENAWKYGKHKEDTYTEYCYNKGFRDATEELKFLRQWKADVVESLCKFDANSIEEVYQYGINRGKKETMDQLSIALWHDHHNLLVQETVKKFEEQIKEKKQWQK